MDAHTDKRPSILFRQLIYIISTVPLTRRDMDWEYPTETVIRTDADAEPPWMGRSDASARRVSVGCCRFMSRAYRYTPNPATSPIAYNISYR